MFSGTGDKKGKSNVPQDGMPSIIAKGLVIEGNLNCDGELQVDGIVTGDISAETLCIGETAHVTGEIDAGEILIRGKVDGGIKGNSVTISSSASVRGDVINSSLSIEPGAKIDGHCKHSDNPREAAEPIALFSEAEKTISE
ncbi:MULTISPECIES: bactofilin family protein [Sneathiella]|jgi:cytoskeletal protein CcmA (bactofilin family)|uniref:bactofilin family protein n=1 Tax=Sneathiella TaxID=510690 RepID=UPI00146EABD3|nr:polymer-forming cytoskeletal protein [Sneathiella aquimaris]